MFIWFPRLAAATFGVLVSSSFGLDAQASGCAVPSPELWAPARGQPAPLNARVTVTLGGLSGFVREVIVRPRGKAAVAVRKEQLPAPVGHSVLALVPEVPLLPDTDYEVVALRPTGWHPSEYVFGDFRTGTTLDERAPTALVSEAKSFERIDASGKAWPWVDLELDVSLDAADDVALFGVWIEQKGSLDFERAPDVMLPAAGSVLRLSTPFLCRGLRLDPVHGALSRFALAPFDAAFNRGKPVSVRLVGPPERVHVD